MAGRTLFDDAALFDFEDPTGRAPQADRPRSVLSRVGVAFAVVVPGVMGTLGHSPPAGVAAAALAGVIVRLLRR